MWYAVVGHLINGQVSGAPWVQPNVETYTTTVASHSALHFLSPGCQFNSAGEMAQVRALRQNGFRRK